MVEPWNKKGGTYERTNGKKKMASLTMYNIVFHKSLPIIISPLPLPSPCQLTIPDSPVCFTKWLHSQGSLRKPCCKNSPQFSTLPEFGRGRGSYPNTNLFILTFSMGGWRREEGHLKSKSKHLKKKIS